MRGAKAFKLSTGDRDRQGSDACFLGFKVEAGEISEAAGMCRIPAHASKNLIRADRSASRLIGPLADAEPARTHSPVDGILLCCLGCEDDLRLVSLRHIDLRLPGSLGLKNLRSFSPLCLRLLMFFCQDS